jgi:serine protease Do
VRTRVALAAFLLATAAAAEDPAGCVWAVRVARGQAGAVEPKETFLAPALPFGAEGVLLAAGFFLEFPRDPEVLEVVAIAPDGGEREAELVGAYEKPEGTFFRVLSGERPAPVPPDGTAPRIGDEVLLLGRHGSALGHAPRRKHARIEAVSRGSERFYAAEDLGGEWLGAVAFSASGGLLGFVVERRTMEEADAFVVGLTDTMAAILPASAFAEIARNPAPPPVKAWLGINLAPFDADREAYFGLAEDWRGAFVSGVAEGSPAAKAGIRVFDLVQRIGDLEVSIESAEDAPGLVRRVQRLPTGRPLPCAIVRFAESPSGGHVAERLQVEVTLEPRPLDFADAPEVALPDLGFKVKPATVDWLSGRSLPLDTKGLVVTRVKSGSPAELAGVLEGDLILALDEAPAADAEAARAALRAAKEARRAKVVLFVRRRAETVFLPLEPNW